MCRGRNRAGEDKYDKINESENDLRKVLAELNYGRGSEGQDGIDWRSDHIGWRMREKERDREGTRTWEHGWMGDGPDRVWMTGGVSGDAPCRACKRWLRPSLVAMSLRLVVSRGVGCRRNWVRSGRVFVCADVCWSDGG